MTEKRFSRMTNHYGTSRTYCTGVYDNQNNRELKNASQVITELNALHKENQELRQDNDIKFWKLQCIQSLNNNQIMLFELSRAIQQGYEVSDKFKQYLNEIKEHDKEIREKHKRLFE